MALRLAVVVSHPPGLGGRPSSGHCSTAASRASAAASSATSMLPKRRIREATTRPYSSRKIRSTSCSDRVLTRRQAGSAWNGRTSTLPLAGRRRLGRELEGGVQVSALQDPEAAEPLLGLRERSVGDDRRAARGVHRRGRLDRLEPTAEHPHAVGHQPLVERVHLGVHPLHLLGGGHGRALDGVHGQHVLGHRWSPSSRRAGGWPVDGRWMAGGWPGGWSGDPLMSTTNGPRPIRQPSRPFLPGFGSGARRVGGHGTPLVSP